MSWKFFRTLDLVSVQRVYRSADKGIPDRLVVLAKGYIKEKVSVYDDLRKQVLMAFFVTVTIHLSKISFEGTLDF